MKKGVWNFILLKNNRGISAIIVTLLMIVLSLVAVGAVWVVISNVLSSGTEQTSSAFGQITLSMKIESVKTNADGDVLVSVKRNAGAGELSGVNLIVSDGTNSQIIKKDESISELATKTFTITSAELTDVAFVKEIQIAPISKDNSGKEAIGNAVDSEILTNKQVLQSLGAVSWWRLNGNAQDEIGSNDGTLEGGVSFTDGKYGNAGSFDGDDYVETQNEGGINGNEARTISLWFKTDTSEVSQSIYASFVDFPEAQAQYGSFMIMAKNNECSDQIGGHYWAANVCSGIKLSDSGLSQWHYAVLTNEGSSQKIYIDGDSKATSSYTINTPTGTIKIGARIYGASNYYFNGLIDEVMIFNKALTDKQVKALYELDLS